ncbi:hypothetical protein [Manganibacter manganicus]|uniref:Uncharacterized protein n=1 Tax=Manganibacter manganicus TaxID=1873176 RepID=A0A1V8RR27_9HYPH|nr:hypothetical protein [Pseudaminobacter manganicus]OQM75593.1 hypothetical protein BFN67_17630 [Pseudaminobacter manganicus]
MEIKAIHTIQRSVSAKPPVINAGETAILEGEELDFVLRVGAAVPVKGSDEPVAEVDAKAAKKAAKVAEAEAKKAAAKQAAEDAAAKQAAEDAAAKESSDGENLL